jgi:hypothetical protein
MNEKSASSISEILADHALITEAINRAVREAVLKHAQAGQPVATWENGKVVWIPPQEIFARLCPPSPPTGSINDRKPT